MDLLVGTQVAWAPEPYPLHRACRIAARAYRGLPAGTDYRSPFSFFTDRMTREKRPVTVLLAEDDVDDQTLIKRAFARSRLVNDVRIVENGEELMDYLHRRGTYMDPERAPMPCPPARRCCGERTCRYISVSRSRLKGWIQNTGGR